MAVEPGVCYGQTDVDVASSFEEEAERVRLALEGCRFSRVFTSPLTRCVKLAEYCGFGGAVRDSRLMEMNFGEWEMQRFDEISDPRLQLWYDDYIHIAPTGGESFLDQQRRIKEFMDELCAVPTATRRQTGTSAGEESILVFTHAGVITHAKVIAGMADSGNAFADMPRFGEIVRICYGCE